MRSFLTVAVAVTLTAVCAQAQMTMVDDLESYNVGDSLYQLGSDGVGAFRWSCQENTSFIRDSQRDFIVDDGGNKCIMSTTQDPPPPATPD